MFMIYFLRHFMKYKNSENRFSEFSLSWKTLLLNLFLCLINPFVINDVYKSLKENVSITWKASKVVFVSWEAVVQRCSIKKVLKKETLAQVFSFFVEHPCSLLLYFIYYKIWRILKIDWSSFFEKLWMKTILMILMQLQDFKCIIWGALDSTKSGHFDKIRCSVKSLPSCVGYWHVLDYNLEGKLQATWQN